jgi:hypothetical protein
MKYPKMIRVVQQLDDSEIGDIDLAVSAEMQKIELPLRIKPGSKVAITVGSRGITDNVSITRAIIAQIRELEAEPFVVPAMGSHGGATAEGQTAILSELGITESNVGAPVISSMEVDEIGITPSGVPVMIDRVANGADHIIVVNRVKPHTEFQGEIESGLMKMMVIGLGKLKGTVIAHNYAVKYGYEKTIMEMGQCILANTRVVMGIGIIENGFGKTSQINACLPERLIDTEKDMLRIARQKCPKLPFDQMDILIVDECGKEISGTGMDTKVIGRIMNIYELEVALPKITRVILRGLTEKTHGNAIGIGLADFITRSVADNIDYRSTYVNSVTAVTPEKARLPIVCENDKEAIDFAIATAGPVDADSLKLVWIKNTSTLGKMHISKGLENEARKNKAVTILDEIFDLEFDANGNLKRFN